MLSSLHISPRILKFLVFSSFLLILVKIGRFLKLKNFTIAVTTIAESVPLIQTSLAKNSKNSVNSKIQPEFDLKAEYFSVKKFKNEFVIPKNDQASQKIVRKLKHTCSVADLKKSLTQGHWIYPEYSKIEKSYQILLKELLDNNQFRGFPPLLWSENQTNPICGVSTQNSGKKFDSRYLCNPIGPKPVCLDWTSEKPSVCVEQEKLSQNSNQISENSVNFFQEYQFPELGRFLPDNKKCPFNLYNSETICSAFLNSKYKTFYFVGDSLTRNQFFGLLTIFGIQAVANSQTEYQSSNADHAQKPYTSKFDPPACLTHNDTCCLGFQKIYVPKDGCNIRYLNYQVCDQKINLQFHWFDDSFLWKFKNLIQNSKSDEIFFLNLGAHYGYTLKTVLNKYLVKIFAGFYQKSWEKLGKSGKNFTKKSSNSKHHPETGQLIWVKQLLPNQFSKLYPYHYQIDKSYIMYDEIEKLLNNKYKIENSYKIDYVDFSNLCQRAVSWDGTHYTFANAIMRNQILLNFLEFNVF